jgi:hypothetical protein
MENIAPSIDIALQLITSVQIGEEIRDFTLITVDGKTFSLCNFRGKDAVVLGIGNPYK